MNTPTYPNLDEVIQVLPTRSHKHGLDNITAFTSLLKLGISVIQTFVTYTLIFLIASFSHTHDCDSERNSSPATWALEWQKVTGVQ